MFVCVRMGVCIRDRMSQDIKLNFKILQFITYLLKSIRITL